MIIIYTYSVGYRCPDNYNSADFIMKILSDSNKSVKTVCDEFAASKHAEIVKNAIANEIYFVSIIVIHTLSKNYKGCTLFLNLCLQYNLYKMFNFRIHQVHQYFEISEFSTCHF